jgi:hypothetical protein
MSGIIATLQMRSPNVTLPEVMGGYVHLCPPRALRSDACPPYQSFDMWRIELKYYACPQDFATNPGSNIIVDGMYLMDGITLVMTALPNLPYVPNTDIMNDAKILLQEWWPEGTILP